MPEQAKNVDSGAAVRAARLRTGQTLRQLAASIGVSVGTMSAIENGKVGLTVDRLRLIAESLGVPPSHLLRPQDTEAARVQQNSQTPRAPGSKWWVFDELSLDPVLASAVEVFCDTGYHGATMRMIAAGADISVAGIYHHYPSKKHLLVELIDKAHRDLLWRLQAAVDAGSDAAQGFSNMVEALVLFREKRHSLAFVMIAEASRAEVLIDATPGIDRELRNMFEQTAYRAVREGLFNSPEPHLAIVAILTMCLAPSSWIKTAAVSSPAGLAHAYATLALSMMQYRPNQAVRAF